MLVNAHLIAGSGGLRQFQFCLLRQSCYPWGPAWRTAAGFRHNLQWNPTSVWMFPRGFLYFAPLTPLTAQTLLQVGQHCGARILSALRRRKTWPQRIDAPAVSCYFCLKALCFKFLQLPPLFEQHRSPRSCIRHVYAPAKSLISYTRLRAQGFETATELTAVSASSFTVLLFEFCFPCVRMCTHTHTHVRSSIHGAPSVPVATMHLPRRQLSHRHAWHTHTHARSSPQNKCVVFRCV